MTTALASPPAPSALPPAVDLPDGSITLLVVDPSPVCRIGLAVLLRRQPWVARCLLAGDAQTGAALAERHRPDVAIVDVSGAVPFLAEDLSPLREARPSMPILLGTRYQATLASSAARADAAGFLAPSSSPEEIVGAVREALVGEGDPIVVSRGPASDPAVPRIGLSEREREVLVLLRTGATNREIAALMNVGTETVKKHAHAVYRKLGVRNRTEAAQRAADLLAA